MVEYTATTTNAKDAVTATPTDEDAKVVITLGDAVIENGGDATWSAGENVLTISVSEYDDTTEYTVTVTHGE